MSPLQQLDEAITTHVLPIAKRYQWQEVTREESSRGASRDYVGGSVYIRLTHERGLTEIEIGCQSGKDLRPVSFYKDLLTPSPQGRWNMSLEQASQFIESRWEWLNENLSAKKAPETIRAVDENAKRRV